MKGKFGFSVEDWECAKREIRGLLIELATHRRTISYSELIQEVQTIELTPHSKALAVMLGEISAEEHEAGRGMLTSIVISKSEEMPGPGFFHLAEKLGRDVTDRIKCWVDELNQVYGYWSTTSIQAERHKH